MNGGCSLDVFAAPEAQGGRWDSGCSLGKAVVLAVNSLPLFLWSVLSVCVLMAVGLGLGLGLGHRLEVMEVEWMWMGWL